MILRAAQMLDCSSQAEDVAPLSRMDFPSLKSVSNEPGFDQVAPSPAILALLVLTTLALTGCGLGSGSASTDKSGTDNVQSARVILPPSIKVSHVYRCKDNSIISIDFLSDNVTATFRSGTVTSQLRASAPGEAFTDGTQTVIGGGAAITLTRPGKASQSCKI
jgi:hypothetical protein